jgi:hypothetical protein
MKQLALSGKYGLGKFALVDDEDFEKVLNHSWQIDKNKGYVFASFKINGKWLPIKLHRFLLDNPKGLQVDHINGDKLDNRRENLRVCTHSENLYNWPKSKKRKYSSIYKGVSFNGKKWLANISKNRHQYYIGSFDKEHWAAMAYDIAAKDLHGQYAYLNF